MLASPITRDEDGAQAGHDVKGVVQELDVRRPVLRREGVQSSHLAVERSIREEAEHAGNLDRVVEAALFDVRLTDQRDFRHLPGLEAALHRGECRLLVTRDHLGLHVPGRKRHEDCRDQSGHSPMFQVQPRLIAM